MSEPRVENPAVVDLVRGALALRGASLVIYRRRTLIEFKTERLGGGLTLYEEDGHTSWQIGDFDDHHCHLDVGECARASFGAEPVSCQGGRLNYTVWFLVDRDAENPYRRDAYFSVTLNRPYEADGAVKREIVGQMFRLYRAFEGRPGIAAEPAFLEAMAGHERSEDVREQERSLGGQERQADQGLGA
jgi:hypothetical protein